MAYLKYYREETQRYAEVEKGKLTEAEVLIAFKKLFRHFRAPELRVEFTHGRRHAHYSSGGHIRINMDWGDWHTVAHEMGHYLDHLDRRKKVAKLRDQLPSWPISQVGIRPQPEEEKERCRDIEERIAKIRNRRWHGKHHARFTDLVFRYIQKQDWETGSLRKMLDDKHAAREQREQEKRALKKSHEYRIQKRAQQVAHLEKKIRALTTRLKTARRSLAALERARTRILSIPQPATTPEK